MKQEKPKQKRSQKTVEYIEEATIQVLDSDEGESFTTNHIASRAGISVGTIYRYFPDKGAILRFIVRRAIDRHSGKAFRTIEETKAQTAAELVEELVDLSLSFFSRRIRAEYTIRRLARQQPDIAAEVRDVRKVAFQRLSQKAHELEPTRYRVLTLEEGERAAELFNTSLLIFHDGNTNPEVEREARLRLAMALLKLLEK